MRFSRWLVSRTPFARVQSVEAELRQLGVLRWVLGVAVLARIVPILWVSPLFFPAAPGELPSVTVWGLWVVGLVVLCTIGVAVPITLPLLFWAYKQFDPMTHANSLSGTMLCLMWLLLIATSAGARVSIDGVWLRSRGITGAVARALYSPLGLPSAAQLRATYLVVFVAYAVMHLGASLHHLQEDAWRQGAVIRIILTSSYLSRCWGCFRDLETWSVGAINVLSWVGTSGQMLFQAGMLPLIFTRWGSRFVVAWGWVFAGVSCLLLQLSFLPVFELLLWAALFHRPRESTRGQRAMDGSLARGPVVGTLVPAAGYAVLLVLVFTQMPYVRDLGLVRSRQLQSLPARLGLDVPNVFNSGDLRMGDAWPVIYRGDHHERLPYHGEDGERLAWVQWNDLFLYASSIAWRQSYRGPQGIADHDPTLLDFLLKVARFDHRTRTVPQDTYVIDYYVTEGGDVRIPASRRFQKRLIGTDRIQCDGIGPGTVCAVAP